MRSLKVGHDWVTSLSLRRVWQPLLANTLQYSCLLKTLPDREACQATVYRVAKSQTLPKWPCTHRRKTFFACGSSAPVRAEHEGGAAAWLVGALLPPSVQGFRLLPPQELWPHQSLFFKPLVAGDQKASLASLSPQLCPFWHLQGFLTWAPSLLFSTSGT